MRNTAKEFLSREEIRQVTQKSDFWGLYNIGIIWLVIGLAFAVALAFPNPLVWLAVLIVLGSRQMALAVLMHESAHFTLMKTRSWNDWLGHWLGAAPMLQHMYKYRTHHLKHHRNTGTEDDPDLRLATGWPVTPGSLRRKVIRDCTGITGFKAVVGSVLMLTGHLEYNVSGQTTKADRSSLSLGQKLRGLLTGLGPALVMQLLIWAALYAAGNGWLYLLWIWAYMTSYQLVLRIRAIAEHAMTTDPEDALNNSRTVRVNWLERALICPLHVNYHLEHHMLAAVPSQNLPTLHKMLTEKQVFEEHDAAVMHGYRAVLRQAASL